MAKTLLSEFSEHSPYFTVNDYGKIKCTITGHEINPGNVDDFKRHISQNTKYIVAVKNGDFEFENFCKFIIPHKRFP